jgi:hypothetical protein
MPQTLAWITVLIISVLLLLVALGLALRRRPNQPEPMPTQWRLAPRAVFSTDERKVYRLLREAFPHHIVLAKLPLLRFCQPTDPEEVRYWFELLGSIHVTFAVCSANGRVLAAVDLEFDRAGKRRSQQIKQAVLAASRVRYLRCPVDQMPSIPDLQALVPAQSGASRNAEAMRAGRTEAPEMSATGQTAPVRLAPVQARTPGLNPRPVAAATTPAKVAPVGAGTASPSQSTPERTLLWHDSGVFNDSFFAPERRLDVPTDFGAMGSGDSGFQPLDPLDSIPAPRTANGSGRVEPHLKVVNPRH